MNIAETTWNNNVGNNAHVGFCDQVPWNECTLEQNQNQNNDNSMLYVDYIYWLEHPTEKKIEREKRCTSHSDSHLISVAKWNNV